MSSTPPSPYLVQSRPATQAIVLLGPAGGGAPDAGDEVLTVQVVQITRTAGGRQLDHATFRYDLATAGERVMDIAIKEEMNRQIEVRLPDDDGEPGQPLFWGEITQQQFRVTPDGEYIDLVAAIHPYHFGGPVEGFEVADPSVLPVGTSTVTMHRNPVFNPEIDGIVEPNREESLTHPDDTYQLWVDPESVRTASAETATSQSAHLWALEQVVNTMNRMLNADEEFLTNPVVLPDPMFAGAQDVKDLHIRRGEHLPTVLDGILDPHGYGWYVALGLDEAGDTTRQIRVFKRGEGTEKELHLQRPGETLDLALTDTLDSTVTYDIAGLANTIVGYGSFEDRELTIELYRGWATADDSLSQSDLDKSDETCKFYTDNKANVWRKWVANEAGDNCETRPQVTFTADAGTDTLTAVAHGFSDSDSFQVTSDDTLPAGLVASTTYYVISATTDTFQLSTSDGGAAVDITDAGTGTHSVDNNSTPSDPLDLSSVFTNWVPKRRVFGDLLTLGPEAERQNPFVEYSTENGAFTADAGTDTFTSAAHGLSDGDIVTVTSNNALPTGLAPNTNYYIVSSATNTFQLSATSGGSAIDITDAGTGAHTWAAWSPATSKTVGQVDVREDELAVYFNDDEPPDLLYDAGANARVRVTGTVTGDYRLNSTATASGTSPNSNDIKLVLDLSERFHDRSVQTTGEFASLAPDQGGGADEADDQDALDTFIEKVRDAEESASVEASLTLAGLRTEYEVGDLITKIDGRDISFNRNAVGVAAKRYLQVMGLVFNPAAQTTVLQTVSVEPILN